MPALSFFCILFFPTPVRARVPSLPPTLTARVRTSTSRYKYHCTLDCCILRPLPCRAFLLLLCPCKQSVHLSEQAAFYLSFLSIGKQGRWVEGKIQEQAGWNDGWMPFSLSSSFLPSARGDPSRRLRSCED